MVQGLPEGWPILAEATGWEAAQAALSEAGLSDGLPLVPPTAARLAAMLKGCRDPALSLGLMPPLFGELTPGPIAYCCVLAGCRPGAIGVVATAALACLAPELNLLGLATTTGTAAVATLVHGPVAEALGLNASTNCLGPGNAANATIGRAVSLVLRSIGGAREGAGDMATMGQPAKYTFCCAEGRHPWLASLAARRGVAEGQSAVTVLGISGTTEVLPLEGDETPAGILDPLAVAMAAQTIAGGASRKAEPPEHVLLLPPEIADRLAGHGLDLARVQRFLAQRTVEIALAGGDGPPRRLAPRIDRDGAGVHIVVTGGPGIKMTYLPLWGGGSRPVTRALVEV